MQNIKFLSYITKNVIIFFSIVLKALKLMFQTTAFYEFVYDLFMLLK